MPAQMQIDQAGLPAGTPGFARTDGLDTGAKVTLTSTGGGSTHEFALLWVPPGDTVAEPSLAQVAPTVWEFTPIAGSASWGSYRIELVVDRGLATESRQVREFSIRTANASLYIPSANTIADPRATILDMGATRVAASEQNEPFSPFVSGSAFGWWRALQEIALAVEGLSGGGGSGVLYDMPIATASVGTAVFVRDEADNPAAPGSTAASSIVDIQAGPDLTAKALRLALSGGSDAGGWIFPIDCGALPDEGFVVEIVFSGMDVNALGGFFMPLADFTTVPGTVEGLAVSFFSGVYNTTAEFDVTSSTFARFVAGPSLQGWPSSPTQSRCDKGPHVQRIEVRREQGTTPATWMVKQTLESPDGTYVVSSAVSGVSNPVTSFDGKTYTQIGIGPWVPGGYTPPCHIDIQSLRVLALGS